MDSLQYRDEDVSEKTRLLTSLEWAFRFAALVVFLYSTYLVVIRGQFWLSILGEVGTATVACVGAVILLSEYCFSHYFKMGAINSIVFSVLFAASFVWAYEIIYYLSFPQLFDFTAAKIVSEVGGILRTVASDGILLLPIILLRKQLSFGKVSAALLAIFSLTWIFWILYGFPQYYTPNYLGWTMYPKIFVASDPYHASLYFNFGSKAVLGVFFASLLKIPYRDVIVAFARRIVRSR